MVPCVGNLFEVQPHFSSLVGFEKIGWETNERDEGRIFWRLSLNFTRKVLFGGDHEVKTFGSNIWVFFSS